MIQHMNLVFQADGLSTGEGAFLMACCNHTDDRGYVIASMQQLADEAHMKMTAAKANKQRLIQRGLLASKERYNPKNGARIADLYRVNLELLASMKRARKDYGPALVEELTFAVPQEKPSSAPRSESDPLLPPSPSPSSLSRVPDGSDVSGFGTNEGEREAATPEDSEAAADGDARNQVQTEADVVVAAYVQALGRPLLNGSRVALRAQAVELLTAGLPVEWVADRAREMAAHPEWKDLIKHADRSRVPIPGQAGPDRKTGGRERCPDHPARYRAGCVECALAVPA